MVKLPAICVLTALVASGAEVVITFAPQGNVTSRVALWSCTACPGKAVPASVILSLATHRGIPWISPATADELFRRKSVWSHAVKAAGFLSAGGAVVTGSDWVKAKPQWTAGLAVGGAVLVVLVPMAQREIPRVDPAVGGPLMVGTDGCGQASFYATPSNVAGFNEVLP